MNTLVKNIKEKIKNNKIMISIIVVLIFILELPFLFVTFVPSTDLPQHIAQLNLLFQTIYGHSDKYVINWFTANTLIYYIMLLVWFVSSPILCGKITLMLLVFLWTISIFYLAKHYHRPLENAVLASILVFNLSLYWGFLNFLVGWPFFVLWIINLSKQKETIKGWFILLILSVFLFFSHALWFLVACIWMCIYSFTNKLKLKSILFNFSTALLLGIYSIIWFFALSGHRSSTFNTAPRWYYPPVLRLSPAIFTDSMLGGINGYLEPFIVIFILVWLFLSYYTNRKDFKNSINTNLIICFVFLMVIVLFAPEVYMNTILFARRWLPCAMILLILSFPKPKLQNLISYPIVFFIIILFTTATAKIWHDFEKNEISGLQTSLNQIQNKSSVLGLDFMKTSTFIKGCPFIQTFSYAQVFKDTELSFSFASHYSEIVSYKNIFYMPWTLGLEWYSEWVKGSDFQYFDYVLINGGELTHSIFAKQTFLKPITKEGRWRLYSIIKGREFKIVL